jgi:hypothetical protein
VFIGEAGGCGCGWTDDFLKVVFEANAFVRGNLLGKEVK